MIDVSFQAVARVTLPVFKEKRYSVLGRLLYFRHKKPLKYSQRLQEQTSHSAAHHKRRKKKRSIIDAAITILARAFKTLPFWRVYLSKLSTTILPCICTVACNDATRSMQKHGHLTWQRV
ncbi:hypothetical protein HYFRA_00012667 [Hymenoscyphus fraxineus]|uniref:Uncharacterized protein n=1 Tax=Hymenoscyphus fraxineus TaxID=746836 RepID=A0A9N9L448_9HELO|nr:hypothetical protein HYFRA_00012667 [Hymenoscyphus fraxineus]